MRHLSPEWLDAARAAVRGHERVRAVARGFDTTIQVSVNGVPSPLGPFNAFLFLETRAGAVSSFDLSYDEGARLRPAEFRVTVNYATLVDMAQGRTNAGGARWKRTLRIDGPKLRSFKVRGLLDAVALATRPLPTAFMDPVTGEPRPPVAAAAH